MNSKHMEKRREAVYLPVQRCSLHHGERCPSRTCRQGLTTEDRTWGPHVAPPAPGQSSLYCPASLSMVKAPHASKISLTLPTHTTRTIENNHLKIYEYNLLGWIT